MRTAINAAAALAVTTNDRRIGGSCLPFSLGVKFLVAATPKRIASAVATHARRVFNDCVIPANIGNAAYTLQQH